MCTIVTDNFEPGTGNIGLILHHDIDDLSLFRTDSNPQTVISVNTDGLYEFLTFQDDFLYLIISYLERGRHDQHAGGDGDLVADGAAPDPRTGTFTKVPQNRDTLALPR